MDSLELSMKSSNLIKRVLNPTSVALTAPQTTATSVTTTTMTTTTSLNDIKATSMKNGEDKLFNMTIATEANIMKENEIENEHFKDIDACDEINLSDSDKNSSDDDCSFNSSIIAGSVNNENMVEHTQYIQSPPEEFGEVIFGIFEIFVTSMITFFIFKAWQ